MKLDVLREKHLDTNPVYLRDWLNAPDVSGNKYKCVSGVFVLGAV